jgi:septal ring factor EnvC (AmiA/AmiB activator)
MAQLDAFTKVKAAIDEMVTALLKEKQDEIKHRDFCIEELAQNDKQNAVSTDEKNDLEANIASLESEIDTLTKDLAALAAEIKEAQVQVKRASEDRELENKEFQQTVADQRATQQILKKALDRLKVVYGFVQTSQPEPGAAAPPPPPGFSDYKQNAGAGGVLTMIQSVINDAKTMEREAIMAEQDSQSAYESFVKNTNDEIAAAMKSTTAKTESKAKAEEALTQAKADLKATMSALEQLASYAADVHQSCDFVLKNFEIRQAARDQEVEALRQAKAVLSGADFA